MQQLECRTYSRTEIAELLSVNPKDSKHFKRNIETKLQNWGYGYEYTTKSITITSKPETPEARLREILIRQLNLDIQIDTKAFACFICAFTDIEGFASMPWGNRELILQQRYKVNVTERTLRNWSTVLIRNEYLAKSEERTFWKTEMCGADKIRTPVPEDDPRMAEYFRRKSELLSVNRKATIENNTPAHELNSFVWELTMKQLWREFNCCYYSCKSFSFNAFDPEISGCLFEIQELTREMIAPPPLRKQEKPERIKVLTKEDFDGIFFQRKYL